MPPKDSRSKGEKDAFHEGKRDGEKGRYRSQGFVQMVGDQIFGKSAERKSYEQGNDRGRSPKKGR